MRTRQKVCVVTFSDTHEAIAFEERCHARGFPGRIIPTPQSISAGCGLAWLIPPGETLSVKDVGAYEAIHEVTLWL